jgi:uncharacterized protein
MSFDPAAAARYDADERLHVRAAILTSGVRKYSPSELPGLEDDPRLALRVWRSPAEVRKAAQGFRGVPIVVGHPRRDEPIDPARVVGIVHDAHWRGGCVEGDLIIWDRDAIANIENGTQAALSAGYAMKVAPTPLAALADAAQVKIVADHVALVDVSRNGPSCSLRHAFSNQ